MVDRRQYFKDMLDLVTLKYRIARNIYSPKVTEPLFNRVQSLTCKYGYFMGFEGAVELKESLNEDIKFSKLKGFLEPYFLYTLDKANGKEKVTFIKCVINSFIVSFREVSKYEFNNKEFLYLVQSISDNIINLYFNHLPPYLRSNVDNYKDFLACLNKLDLYRSNRFKAQLLRSDAIEVW